MERLTNSGTKEAKSNVTIQQIINTLANYEDLEEQKLLLKIPLSKGDKIWELTKCNDGIYRIFPMTVCKIVEFGSIRWVKGKEPEVWNIYACSDYTDMYKSFYDIGKTVFLTKTEAEQKLKELNKINQN